MNTAGRHWLAGLLGLLLSPLLAAQTLSLPELEARWAQQSPTGPDAGEAAADEIAQARSLSGWRLFGRAGLSEEEEPMFNAPDRRYQARHAELGLRYPLLGSRARERLALEQARLRGHYAELEAGDRQRLRLRLLRESYAGLWTAQRQQALTQDYLGEADRVQRQLAARTRADLLREGGRQEHLLSYALARRNLEELKAQQAEAQDTLRLLLPELPAQWSARRPPLWRVDSTAGPPTDPRQARLLEQQRRLAEQQRYWPIDSDIALSWRHINESDAPNSGGGYGLSWQFSLPLGSLGASELRQRRARDEEQRASAELALRQEQEALAFRRALADYQRSRANLDFAHKRLQAAKRQSQEDELRANLLAGAKGDVLERAQSSRYARYLAAYDALAAEGQLFQAQARLDLEDGESDLELARRLAQLDQALPAVARPLPAQQEAATATSTTRPWHFYLWQAAPLLQGRGQALLQALPAGATVWLSFTAEEVKALAQPDGPAGLALAHWLSQAQAQGHPVWLLLGEPSWLRPGGEQALSRLLHTLQPYAFAGLHLDIEPDQLPEARTQRPALLNRLRQLARLAHAHSGRPLGLSLHWRDALPGARPCLLCGLENEGVSEVSLMIYSSSTESVATRAEAILAAQPGLRFQVAQSVEPGLSPQESWAGQGRARFSQAMSTLGQRLARQPNFAGIAVQSWEDFQQMGE